MKPRSIATLLGLLAMLAVGWVTPVASHAASEVLGAEASEKLVPFLAVYGSPGTNGEAVPVGGGLGRNFGFGENMMFQASTSAKIGENIVFELSEAAAGVKAEIRDSYIGSTLMSNNASEHSSVGLAIQFADFQGSKVNGTLTPIYADTSDQPWSATICAPGAECRVDPLFEVGEEGVNLKIEGVSFNIGPGTTLQGALWATWENGIIEGFPPCITFKKPPTAAKADQTLVVTQSASGIPVGTKIKTIAGRACLVSANNNWYSQSEKTEPAIALKGPRVAPNPDTLDFGELKVGNTAVLKTKYTNKGTGSWTTEGIAKTISEEGNTKDTPFIPKGTTCKGRIEEGGECTVEVEFKPEHTESYKTLLIMEPYSEGVTLKGRGKP
jgi:hypothetical protein